MSIFGGLIDELASSQQTQPEKNPAAILRATLCYIWSLRVIRQFYVNEHVHRVYSAQEVPFKDISLQCIFLKENRSDRMDSAYRSCLQPIGTDSA